MNVPRSRSDAIGLNFSPTRAMLSSTEGVWRSSPTTKVAGYPHAQTLRRPVAGFPKVERLALSDIAVPPWSCNTDPLDICVAMNGKWVQVQMATGVRLATLDVRELTRTSFPALEHLSLVFWEDIGAVGAFLSIPIPRERTLIRLRVLQIWN